MSDTDSDSSFVSWSCLDSAKSHASATTDEKCWVCLSDDVDIAYSVDEEDTGVGGALHTQSGLINFDLRGCPNEIPLCPNCHRAFDGVDPRMTIMPTNLQFFIDFEKEDRRRRTLLLAEIGDAGTRRVPCSDEYLKSGGLYKVVKLKHWGPPSFDVTPLLAPKSWKGAPLAMLRRTFPLLGDVRWQYTLKERSQLTELLLLYFRRYNIHDAVDEEYNTSVTADNMQGDTTEHLKRKAEDHLDLNQGPSTTKKTRSEYTTEDEWKERQHAS